MREEGWERKGGRERARKGRRERAGEKGRERKGEREMEFRSPPPFLLPFLSCLTPALSLPQRLSLELFRMLGKHTPDIKV